MTLPLALTDREVQKFREGTDGKPVVAVTDVGALVSVSFDAIQATQVNSVTHRYDYYLGGLSGTLVNSVTVVFPSANAISFTSVVKS